MQDDRHTIAFGAPIDTANWACLAGSMYPVHLSPGISIHVHEERIGEASKCGKVVT